MDFNTNKFWNHAVCWCVQPWHSCMIMNCLWLRLLVCINCARHVENSSGSRQSRGNTKFSEQDSLHSYCMGHSVSKFLPVKLGVLSINVMQFLACRVYEWMLFFFTLPIILIRNCIWSIYWCPSNEEVENFWSFSSTFLHICMALIKNEVT